MASGMEHVLEHDGEVSTLTQSEPDLGRVTLSAELEPGRPLRLFKLLAYHWSSQQSVDWLRDQVDASLESGAGRGLRGPRRGAARGARPLLAARRHRGGGRRRAPAGAALRDVPPLPGRGAQRGPRDPGQGPHRQRLRRPRVLGHRELRAAGAHLHRAATRCATRSSGATPPRLGARARPPARPARRGAAVAHDPRRGVLRLLAGGHGRLPRERRRGRGGAALRGGHRRPRVRAAHRLRAARGERAAVGQPRLPRRARRLPDRRRDRARRVLRAGRQQRLHEPDGAAEPALGRGGHRRAIPRSAAAPRAWTTASAASGSAPPTRCSCPSTRSAAFTRRTRTSSSTQRWDFEDTPPDQYPLLLHYPYFQLYRKQVVKQADLVLAMHWRGDAFTRRAEARELRLLRAPDRARLVAVGVHPGGARGRGRPPRPRARLPRGGGAHGPRGPRAQHRRRPAHGVARRRGARRGRRLRRRARLQRPAQLPPAAAGGHRAAALLAGGARQRAARRDRARARPRTRSRRATRCASPTGTRR